MGGKALNPNEGNIVPFVVIPLGNSDAGTQPITETLPEGDGRMISCVR